MKEKLQTQNRFNHNNPENHTFHTQIPEEVKE